MSNKKAKNNYEIKNYFMIIILGFILIAFIFGVGGFFIGRLSAQYNTVLTALNGQNTADSVSTDDASADVEPATCRFSCKTCGYAFNDLRSLRVEFGGANNTHRYYCLSCGELLTTDEDGNALDTMVNDPTYSKKIINNRE